MKMRRSFLWFAAAPALILQGWGCQPDIPEDPEPGDRVIAVFDSNPDAPTIPLPNDAALEDDGTLPPLTGAGSDDANGAFLSWLDGLHGWSEATPITVPFSGALDESTVTSDNVLMWQQSGETSTQLEVEVAYVPNDEEGSLCNPAVCESIISITPVDPLETGASYAVAVTNGVTGEDGKPVGQSAAIFFAASPEPLVVDNEVQVSVLEDDPATAASLEGLRQLLAPVFAAAVDAGVERDDVVSAFNWTIARDPFTVLDPDTATLPIPNDVALEADGTFPSAALNFCGGPGVDPATLADDSCDAPSPEFASCETAAECEELRSPDDPAVQCIGGRCVYTRCAQGQFDTYLDGLHGWPTTTPITLPVTQPIDPATLTAENVQLWALDSEGTATKVEGTTVSISECGDEIVIGLPDEMPAMNYATEYIAFATRDVTGVPDEEGNALELLPPAAVLLAIMPHEPGEFVGDCSEEEVEQACDGGGVCAGIAGEGFKCVQSTVANASDADAAAVMAIRPLFRPAVEAVEGAADVEWDELAAVWKWTTWTDTFVVFDPTTGNIPFPHTLLKADCPEDGPEICNLPAAEGPTGDILDALRDRTGFSSTAPHWVPTVGPPLDPESVTKGEGVLFAEADEIPPPLFPADEWNVGIEHGRIVARFERPLKPEILVAGLTTTDLMGSNGFPAQPTPAFVFLRSEFPLVDEDGNKLVSQIPDDETAQSLEAARQDFEQLFLVALLFGYSRAQINNAWAFTTGETYRPLQELRARTKDMMGGDAPTVTADPNPVVDPGTVPAPDDMTVDVDVSNIEEIHWNVAYDTFMWLDENNRLVDAGSVTREPVGVSIAVPKDPNPAAGQGCEPPYDVAILQHGLGNFRKNALLWTADELAANCIASVAIDMPLHGGRVAGSPMLHPDSNPAASGDGFVSSDFVGTVDLFKQATLDQVVLAQMIKAGAFDAAVGSAFSDETSNVGHVGTSLGAFTGTLLSTIEPDVTAFVNNVGGGNIALILQESAEFTPLLEETGIPPDTFEELQALHFIQWLAEHIDPYTFAPYPVLDPLPEIEWDGADFIEGAPMPAKDVIIQMLDGDTTVPNTSTELLARTMGVPLDDTTFTGTDVHGFIGTLDPTAPSYAVAQCARQQAAAWLSSSFDPDVDAEIPPELSANSCP